MPLKWVCIILFIYHSDGAGIAILQEPFPTKQECLEFGKAAKNEIDTMFAYTIKYRCVPRK